MNVSVILKILVFLISMKNKMDLKVTIHLDKYVFFF